MARSSRPKVAPPRQTQAQAQAPSWLLTNLRWFSVFLFLVSGSLVWKEVSRDADDASSLLGSSSSRSQTLLDLPLELRNAMATTTTAADDCQTEYQRATKGRTPGLTMDDLERSRALTGNRHRLAILARKLHARETPVTAVVCGGSVTLGHGVVPSTMRYSDRLQVWLNEKYPSGTTTNNNKGERRRPMHQVLNRGAHGADMCAMAKRVNVMIKDLPSEPDLFVLEFAVNDYQGQDHKIHLDHKTDVFFEGFEPLVLCAEIVVHTLLNRFPNTALLFLEVQTAIVTRKTAALLHMGVAKHYQVPVISYAESLFPDFYRLMHRLKDQDYSTATISHHETGSSTPISTTPKTTTATTTVDPVLPFPHGCVKCQDHHIAESFRDKGCKSLCVFAERSGEEGLNCKQSPPGREPCYVSFLAHDAVHPSAAGHQIAADLIAESIVRAGLDVCNGREYQDHILPTVGLMVGDPKILEKRSNFILVKDTMQVFATQDPLQASSHSSAFKLFGDSVDRPGWIATNPKGGETIEFLIELPQHHCYVVNLAILKSYEKMGTFTVTTTDLATKKETAKKLDGLWLPRISVPSDIQITSDEDPGCTGRCKVKVTTDGQVEGRLGNKVKITTLSVRECL